MALKSLTLALNLDGVLALALNGLALALEIQNLNPSPQLSLSDGLGLIKNNRKQVIKRYLLVAALAIGPASMGMEMKSEPTQAVFDLDSSK